MTFDLEGARERQRREPHDVLGDEDAAEMHVRPADGNPGDVLLRAAEGAAVPVGGRAGAGRFRAGDAGLGQPVGRAARGVVRW